MSEQHELIRETAERVFRDLCTKELVDSAEAGEWPTGLWTTLAETGLPLVGLSEEYAGSGGDTSDMLAVLREAGRFCVPLPLAETYLAGRLIEQCGGQIPAGPMTVATGNFTLSGGRLSGHAQSVPFARDCETIVVPVGDGETSAIAILPRSDAEIERRRNLAGEARDGIVVNGARAPILTTSSDPREDLLVWGAMTRSVMMSGALSSVLEMSVSYALERAQFGRPIAKFQAIQQQLAVLAGEVAASLRAADSLLSADPDVLDIAIAKSRIGEAVAPSTEIAHQVHGAIGYTLDHALNLRTRRLWCWREEHGNEAWWQRRLARGFIEQGPDRLWPGIAALA